MRFFEETQRRRISGPDQRIGQLLTIGAGSSIKGHGGVLSVLGCLFPPKSRARAGLDTNDHFYDDDLGFLICRKAGPLPRRLPNLNRIRAFEAAARHLSFKDAADELHVTHAAVSHQIKALEQELGRKLFVRLTREVRLTDAGRAFLPDLTRALDLIAQATTDVTGDRMEGRLTLSIAPFYGNRMVLPRLDRFHAAYPDLQIVANMSAAVVDFRKSDIDAAIRYGKGNWPGTTALLLHSDVSAPLCAPDYVAEKPLPLPPSDIARMTLACVAGREYEWQHWFTAVGFSPQKPLRLVPYENRARALDLALSGHGACLADIRLLADDLEAGHLVRLHPHAAVQDMGMYVVFPQTSQPDPRVLALAEWLKQDINAS